MVLAVMAQDADTDHIRYYISKLDTKEYDMVSFTAEISQLCDQDCAIGACTLHTLSLRYYFRPA